MHWADMEAKKIMDIEPPYRIATGITPSGHIHVGNMREIITGDAVYRALRERDQEATLYYIADSFDPLRKVYPFLDRSYEKYVGQPISDIPCPCGDHESYADHFLEPFLASIHEIGIFPTVKYVNKMYKKGFYYETIKRMIGKKETVREILERVTGRQLKRDWFPYTPRCSGCNTFADTRVLDYSDPWITYVCKCGNEGRTDIRTDDGKLPWRIEWPARWHFLGINCEPFGKDHAASGGSYESGKEIMESVLGGSAPHPVVYEWIQLKGKGAMSSSKGVVVTAVDMLEMTPPEVLRFLVMRVDPPKHIDFNPGFGVLNLVDEYDRYEELFHEPREDEKDLDEKIRIFELSQVLADSLKDKVKIPQISYRHLVSLVQIDPTLEEVIGRVKRTEKIDLLSHEAREQIEKRLKCARFWVDNFAPDSVRFSIRHSFDRSMIKGFGAEELMIVEEISRELSAVSWEAEEIHNALYNVKENMGSSPKKVFSIIYRMILNQDRGPRVGYFLSSLSRNFILGRIDETITAMTDK